MGKSDEINVNYDSDCWKETHETEAGKLLLSISYSQASCR